MEFLPRESAERCPESRLETNIDLHRNLLVQTPPCPEWRARVLPEPLAAAPPHAHGAPVLPEVT